MLHKLKVNVYHNSGKASKYLANRLQAKYANSKISHIIGEDGTKNITPTAISQEFAEFYSKLYNLNTSGNVHLASKDEINSYLQKANLPQIDLTQEAELLKPIKMQEVLNVIMGLPRW
ncbi:Hypothetical predicted protein [Pelobates cultripes]|uniref:Uncharacterized protein n=1 Tax=Pelobates cultripes TaxID=61616 RepID=A0AAD1SZZ9_PELCU|nr:Hypothetical predicted protein [Pelobates cultripes]